MATPPWRGVARWAVTSLARLVEMLDGKTFEPEAERDGFQYFKTDPLMLDEVNYRLIWLLEGDEIYIGVINAFRR